MLKADLHIHTKEDPADGYIKYTARDAIDRAAQLGFDVLSITNHDHVLHNERLEAYAASKGIVLIPGVERTVRGRHVLLYNVENSDVAGIRDFDDIRALKKRKKDVLVTAPHPYFIYSKCLMNLLDDNIDVFDCIEYAMFHTKLINLNVKAVLTAGRHGKTIVAGSDAHRSWQIGRSYSLIYADKSRASVLAAIKEGAVDFRSKPLSTLCFVLVLLESLPVVLSR